jgi:hypothetical protein
MHGLRGVTLFEPGLIEDMHVTYNATCRKLGLSTKFDKATMLVVSKVVELAKTGLSSPRKLFGSLRNRPKLLARFFPYSSALRSPRRRPGFFLSRPGFVSEQRETFHQFPF